VLLAVSGFRLAAPPDAGPAVHHVGLYIPPSHLATLDLNTVCSLSLELDKLIIIVFLPGDSRRLNWPE